MPPTSKKTESSRIAGLFRHIKAVLDPFFQPGIPIIIPNSVRASIKTKINLFVGQAQHRKFLLDVGDMAFDIIYTLVKQIDTAGDVDAINFPTLVSQVKDVEPLAPPTSKPLPDHVYLRQIMSRYLKEIADWRERDLSDLLQWSRDNSDKMDLPEIDVIRVLQVLSVIHDSPPLAIPRDLVNPFLENADFKANTPGDPIVFCRQNGFAQLTRILDGPDDPQTMGKKIAPLISCMGEKDRRLYRIRFLSLDQLREFIKAYQQNPFSIYDTLNSYIQIRMIKMLSPDNTTVLDPPKTSKKYTAPARTGMINFNTDERPLLYMILRPWVVNLKDFLIQGRAEYYDAMADDDDGWYYPNAAFFAASCNVNNSQKGTVYILKPSEHQVRLKYRTLDGQEFLQTEDIFRTEQLFFRNSPMYDFPFLERACQRIRIAYLDDQLRGMLRVMGRDLLAYSLTQILSSSRFRIHAMASMIIDNIMMDSVMIDDLFVHIFRTIHRLDGSVCPTAAFQRIHHRRLRQCMYNNDLATLHRLSDGMAFPEKFIYLNASERQKVDRATELAQTVFVRNQVYAFRIRLYPFQRIKSNKPLMVPHAITDISLPDLYPDFDYAVFYEEEIHDLRKIAADFIDDNLETPLTGAADRFFDLERVYYIDCVVGTFWNYPSYYIPETDTNDDNETSDHQVDAAADNTPSPFAADFWETFEDFVSQLEAKSPRTQIDVLSEDEGDDGASSIGEVPAEDDDDLAVLDEDGGDDEMTAND